MTNSFGVNSLSSRGPSRALWGDLFSTIRNDPSRGVLFFDDFENMPAHISDQSTGKYATEISSSVTIKSSPVAVLSNGEAGVLEIAGNGTTNDEGYITAGGGSGTFMEINDTAGEEGGVYFEGRFKKASIAATGTAFFLGLAEEGTQAASALTTDGVLVTTKDFIGFHCTGVIGQTVNAVYQKGSQTPQTNLAAAHTLVADTWVKLGFKYAPWLPTANRITWYVNGTEKATYVTGTQIAAATFPNGEELTVAWLTRNLLTTTASSLSLDWWCAAQLFPGVVPV